MKAYFNFAFANLLIRLYKSVVAFVYKSDLSSLYLKAVSLHTASYYTDFYGVICQSGKDMAITFLLS